MPMDNVTLENTQQSISSRDAKSVASVMVNGKWVNLSDTLEQANVKSDVGTVAKQVAAQQEVVSNAVSVADSAQSAADAAVASAQVTSDAVSAIASATAEAKQGANDALSRAKSAWDVATGAKEAVTDFDPLLKSAQSDASKALTQIADTANALSDAKTAFTSDVAEAKNLASTAQTTADNAVKSASSVANDLTAVASQAKANADGITKVTSDVGLLQTTVANNTGDISTIQETAKQIQQAVSDNAGNITVVKQTADSAVAVASDARSNATVAVQTASQASITAQNASGQAASAVITANGAMTTASNANSYATVAVQTANGASLTATNATNDATIAKQTASEAKIQASNAESDFAQLSIRANKIEANVANNSGAIASVQQTANGLTTTVAGIKANGGGVNLAHNTSNAYVVPGDPINGYKNIGSLSNDEWVSLAGETITIGVTIEWTNWQVSGNNRIGFELAPAKNGTGYWNNGFGLWCHPENGSSGKQRVTVTRTLNDDMDGVNEGFAYVQGGCDTAKISELMIERGSVAHDWSPSPDDLQNQFTQTKASIDGINTTINDPKTGLNATYQTAQGNASTISNVKGDVTQLQTTANGLTSRVGNLESKTNTQETEIQQNKNAITLKADQTAVDKINGTVSQLQSSLTVQAGQIQEKVTSSQVTGMLAGYATQDYTQSLVTQKAGEISESIVKLDQTVKQGAENNVQLVRKSDFEDGDKGSWSAQTIVITDPPAELGQSGMKVLQTNSRDAYEDDVWYSVKPGENFDVDFWCKPSTTCYSQLGLVFADKDYNILAWYGIATNQSGQWKHYTGTITAPANASFAKPWFQMNKDGSNTTDTALLAKPSIRRQNATTVAAIQQITASIDGLQSNVTNFKNDTSSQITQLSNNIQSKVSSADFNSKVTQLSNDINLRVTKGNIVSQINQEAGGNTLIQVANGEGKLALNASSVVFSGSAFIPAACIADLTADKIKTGTLTGSTVHLGDSSGNTIDLGVLGTNHVGLHSSAQNGDQTYIDSDGIHNYGATYDTKISQGMITTNLLTVNGGGLIDFRSGGSGATLSNQELQFYNSNSVNGGLSFSGSVPIAPVADGVGGNELRIRYDRSFAVTPISDDSARICASPAVLELGFVQSGSSTPDLNNTGLWVDRNNRYMNLGVWETDSTWTRIAAGSHNIQMQANDAHAWLYNNNFHIYRDNDGGSATATELQVDGWAWVRGWVEAAGHSQHSALSTKTDIQPVDDDKMLKMVNDTDLTTFLYKTDVASGETHRHIGLIIDDVHDVAQYQAPQDFIAPNGVSRDDDNMIGALFGAVKALTKRIKALESKAG